MAPLVCSPEGTLGLNENLAFQFSWVSLGASPVLSEPQFASFEKWVQFHLLLRVFGKSNEVTDVTLAGKQMFMTCQL